MQNSIDQDSYDAMVARIGKEEADRQVRQYGWKITPASEADAADYGLKAIPASQVSNLLGEGALSTAMGGGDDMGDNSLANEGVLGSDPNDDNLADAYASLGGLSAMDLTDPKQISQAILANAAEQRKRYDNLANEIKQRRYGPSETEKLLALSAAFFQPTTVRGFSGTMGNVLPVLQKFGELKRTGEEKRAEALQGLAKQRAALGQGDLKTAIELQRLMRTYPTGTSYDQQRGIFVDKNNPRPTQNVYSPPGTNRELVQWQDGLWRENMPDGSMKVFERSGDNFKELRVERAK